MSVYPGAYDEFREVENLPGIVYNPADKKTVFAEDTSNSFDAIAAIEDTLGLNPQGDAENVANRITNAEDEALALAVAL